MKTIFAFFVAVYFSMNATNFISKVLDHASVKNTDEILGVILGVLAYYSIMNLSKKAPKS